MFIQWFNQPSIPYPLSTPLGVGENSPLTLVKRRGQSGALMGSSLPCQERGSSPERLIFLKYKILDYRDANLGPETWI